MELREFYRSKRGKWVAWCGVGLLVYAFMGFLVVPWLVGLILPGQVGKLLGREVVLEQVRVNPFALSGSIRGFEIKEKDGSTFLSLGEGYANFQLSSLFRWTWTFKEVRAIEPYVQLQINPDYTLNVSDIVEKLASKEGGDSDPDEPVQVPPVRVRSLVVSNALAVLADRTLREPFRQRIGPTDIWLDDFYTLADEKNPYSIRGTTPTGEEFVWSGQVFLLPLRSHGSLKIENVRIPNLAPLIDGLVSLKVIDGVVNVSADYNVLYSAKDRQLSVTNAAFHLASLKVHDTSEGEANALEVDDLQVSDVSGDLANLAMNVGSIKVNGGGVAVNRNADASINVMNMAQPSRTNAPTGGAVVYAIEGVTNILSAFLDTTNRGVIRVEDLEVTDWAVRWKDEVPSRDVLLVVDQISVTGTNLSNMGGTNMHVSVAARWNTNGNIKVDLDTQFDPIRSDVHIQLDQLEVSPLDPYAEPFANVYLVNGKFSMDAAIRVRGPSMDESFTAEVEGGLRLDDFELVEGEPRAELLSFESVELSGIRADLTPELSLDSIMIVAPKMRLVIETNRTINALNAVHLGNTNEPFVLPEFVRSGGEAANAAPEPKQVEAESDESEVASALANLPRVSVASIVFTNATLELFDQDSDPEVEFVVSELSGLLKDVSTDSNQVSQFRIVGQAGASGNVELAGSLRPLAYDQATKAEVNLAGMDLIPFGPYVGRYAGYTLRKGTVNLDVDAQITDRNLMSSNVIVLNQFTLGEKTDSPDATKLPVKLGVAVLKDRKGMIEFDIPVEGSLDDPEFGLGKVVGQAVGKVLANVATSPFKLLGGIAGSAEEDLSTFEFEPGSAKLTALATNKLHKLAQALYERPGLLVKIEGSVDLEADGAEFKMEQLEGDLKRLYWSQLRAEAQAETRVEDIELAPDQRKAAMRKLFVEKFPDKVRSISSAPGAEDDAQARIKESLVREIELDEDKLVMLATERAQALKDHLETVEKVESDRLSLAEADGEVMKEGAKVVLTLE